MSENDRWQMWAADWQSANLPELGALRAEASRKRRQMQIYIAFELAITSTAAMLLIWVLIEQRCDVVLSSVLMFLLLLVVVVEGMAIYARRNTWRTISDTPIEWLQLAIRRAKVALYLISLQIGATVAALLPVGLALWHLFSDAKGPEAQAHLIMEVKINVFANAVIQIPMLIWALWYAQRQRRKIRNAEAILSELRK